MIATYPCVADLALARPCSYKVYARETELLTVGHEYDAGIGKQYAKHTTLGERQLRALHEQTLELCASKPGMFVHWLPGLSASKLWSYVR